MHNVESATKGLAINLTLPDLRDPEVRGNIDRLRPNKSHLAELVFGLEGLMLAPLLKVAQHESLVLLDVVDEDDFLVGITVPVLRLVLLVNSSSERKDM